MSPDASASRASDMYFSAMCEAVPRIFTSGPFDSKFRASGFWGLRPRPRPLRFCCPCLICLVHLIGGTDAALIAPCSAAMGQGLNVAHSAPEKPVRPCSFSQQFFFLAALSESAPRREKVVHPKVSASQPNLICDIPAPERLERLHCLSIEVLKDIGVVATQLARPNSLPWLAE